MSASSAAPISSDPRRLERVADGVLLILTAAAVVPFWSAELLALTDWPHHLASVAVIRDLDDPARGLSRFYELALVPRPYLGLTYLLWGLSAALPLPMAGKVALSLYAIALSAAVRALVRAAPGRDPRLAWFGPLFVHSWALAYGFVPYVWSLPPALYAVAQARRLIDDPCPQVGLRLGLAQVVAALMHPLGWGLSVLAAAPLGIRASRRGRMWSWGATALVGLFVIIAPQLQGGSGRFMDLAIETRWRWKIKHKLVDYALAYLPGDLDSIVGLIGLGALVGAIVWGWRRPRALADPLEASFGALALLYVLAPVNLVAMGLRMSLLSPRLIVPLWLLAIPMSRGRVGALAAIGAAASLAQSALLVATHQQFSASWADAVTAGVGAVPPGASVYVPPPTIGDSVLNPRAVRPPEAALHVYVLLGRAGYDPGLFSTPQAPVRIRPEAPAADAPSSFDLRWVQTATAIRIEPIRKAN